METKSKEVPFKEGSVTLSAFLKAVGFMTLLEVAVVLILWKCKLGNDRVRLIEIACLIMLVAGLMVNVTHRVTDPVFWCILNNIFFISLIQFGVEKMSDGTPFPFMNLVLAAFLLSAILSTVREMRLEFGRAIPVLVAQQLVLCAGFIGLRYML